MRSPIRAACPVQGQRGIRDPRRFTDSPAEARRWLLAARPLEEHLCALGIRARVRRWLALEMLARIAGEEMRPPEDASAQAIRELRGWCARRSGAHRVSGAREANGATAWRLTAWLAGRRRP